MPVLHMIETLLLGISHCSSLNEYLNFVKGLNAMMNGGTLRQRHPVAVGGSARTATYGV